MEMANAKCYSHQVNPEKENNYSVFIANYVYWLVLHKNSVNFIKIMIKLTKFEVEFSLLSATISIITAVNILLGFLSGF